MKKITKLLAMSIIAILFFATGCKKETDLIQKSPEVATVTPTTSVDTTVITTQSPNLKDCPELRKIDGATYINEAIKRGELQNVGQVPVTLFINSGGKTGVPGNMWGIAATTFNCPKLTTTQLPSTEKGNIFRMVTEDYSPFVITVVNTLTAYQQAQGLKMEFVLTNKTTQMQASPILGGVSGAAYINSILWQNGTIAIGFANEFVGSDKYKKIAEMVSHELGHTFGLYHQSEISIFGEYRWPSEDLQNGAIMGNPYQAMTTRFIDGPASGLNWQTQYDAQVIASVAGWKDEPYSDVLNLVTTPVVAGTIITATLVHSENKHAFQKTTNGTKTARLKSKGNGNFALLIYSSPTDPNPILVDPPNTNDVIISVTGKKLFEVVFVQPAGYAFSEAGATYTFQCK